MKIVGKTDIGRVRNTNQDAFKILALGAGAGLALVCDGMGGASGGDRASALAKEVITEVVCARYRDDMGPDAVKIAVRGAVMEAMRRRRGILPCRAWGRRWCWRFFTRTTLTSPMWGTAGFTASGTVRFPS